MRDGWETKRLGDVADVYDGPHATPKTVDSGPIFLGISALEDGEINLRETRHVTEEDFSKWTRRVRPRANDVVFSYETRLGQAAIIPEGLECCLGRRMGLLRFNNGAVFPQYFLYQYISPQFREFLESKTIRGATVDRLLIKDFPSFPILLPPLPEQQRIVALLDEVFAGLATAKANAERNLQNARAIFESHLQSVFSQRGEGWLEKALSELCDIKHGYAFEGEFFSAEGDYVLLTPGNFYEAGGYRDRGEKQKYFTGDIPRDYVLREGDLLVAMTEQAAGLLGSSLLVPESDKFLHNQRLGLVTAKPNVAWSNEFFFHVFNTQHVRREIHASASGVMVRHTSPTKIGDVIVSFPLSLQEKKSLVAEFASVSAETQRLTRLYERKLAALEELKKSLLHQAFNGEL